ncbi:MAG: TatD family hydrolase [Pseudomonadota bacterium]
MLIDVHVHPFEAAMDPNTSGVMVRAREAGVVAAIAAGLDATTNAQVLDLSRRVPGLAPAVGYHPWFLEPGPDMAALARLATTPGVVAIGEIGLDGKIETPAHVQERWFRDQLALAQTFNLPVIVHARGAVARVSEILAEFPQVRGVLHSFPGGPDIAQRLVDAGWCVSFSGSVTRPGAKRVHRLARELPGHGILLETDAPAIGLEGVPAEDVEPRHVAQIAAAVAALREMDAADLASVTLKNARRLFGPRLDRYL